MNINVSLSLLEPEVAQFYYTMRLGAEGIRHTMPQDLNKFYIAVEMTPLSWILFVPVMNPSETRRAILDALLAAGANPKTRDQTGLSAYDHARILKFDQDIVSRLRVSVANPLTGQYGMLGAIRNCQSAKVLEILKDSVNVIFELDQGNLSSLALAVNDGHWKIASALLEAGASHFAIYVDSTTYYHSLDFVLLQYDDKTRVLDRHVEASTSFRAWLRSRPYY